MNAFEANSITVQNVTTSMLIRFRVVWANKNSMSLWSSSFEANTIVKENKAEVTFHLDRLGIAAGENVGVEVDYIGGRTFYSNIKAIRYVPESNKQIYFYAGGNLLSGQGIGVPQETSYWG